MKVFKKGNKNYIYYRRCEECGSIISFMKYEIDTTHQFYCPVCNSRVYAPIYLYEDDPYLGDKEVKKEVEEYIEQKLSSLPVGPMCVPSSIIEKKEEINVKSNSNNFEEIVEKAVKNGEFKNILEKILKEVQVPPLKETL